MVYNEAKGYLFVAGQEGIYGRIAFFKETIEGDFEHIQKFELLYKCQINAMAYNENHNVLYTGGYDGKMIVWAKDKEKKFVEFQTISDHKKNFTKLIYNAPTNELFSACNDTSTIFVWKSKPLKKNLEKTQTLEIKGHTVSDMVYNKEKGMLFACNTNITLTIFKRGQTGKFEIFQEIDD